MIRVLVESPYAGDVENNLRYLRAAMRDCFLRGEAPFASHALYTQPGVLDDDIPQERQLGIDAGLLWGAQADKTIVYADLGISRGMENAITRAILAGRAIEYRTLSGWDRQDKTYRVVRYNADGCTGEDEGKIIAEHLSAKDAYQFADQGFGLWRTEEGHIGYHESEEYGCGGYIVEPES